MISQLSRYPKNGKAILLFSGGLDTTFLTYYFSHELHWDIYAVSFNLGGIQVDYQNIHDRALAAGAKEHSILDVKDIFISDYVKESLLANGRYFQTHPLSSSLSRPLMMKEAVKEAQHHHITTIIHGSNRYQNNWARFEMSLKYLNINVSGFSPIRECDIKRTEMVGFLSNKGFSMGKKNLYSSDINVWATEIEDHRLEKTDWTKDDEVFDLYAPKKNKKTFVISVGFKSGVPNTLDGKEMSFNEIIRTLTIQTYGYGIGFFDAMESRSSGTKEREIHYAPVADILLKAHHDIELSTLSEEELYLKSQLDSMWNLLVCHGFWFHPLTRKIGMEIRKLNRRVSGTCILSIAPGRCSLEGRTVQQHTFLQRLLTENQHEKNMYQWISNVEQIVSTILRNI